MPTSHLLRMGGGTVLVDAGLGCSRSIVEQGVPLAALDAIVITHLHSDHYLELGPLIHTAWTTGMKKPIAVYGPSGLAEYWRGFVASMAFDIDLRIRDEGRPDFGSVFEFHLLEDGAEVSLGALTMRVMLNVHPPLKESFALRFDGPGKSVTFSGDTAPMDELSKFAKGSDILIHEAMLLAGVDALCARVGTTGRLLNEHLLRSHTAASEVGRIATNAGVKALVLNHLVPGDDPEITEDHWRQDTRRNWNGPLHIGQDGMAIEF